MSVEEENSTCAGHEKAQNNSSEVSVILGHSVVSLHTETPLSIAKARSHALWDHLFEPQLSECGGDVQTATQLQEKGHCALYPWLVFSLADVFPIKISFYFFFWSKLI